LIVVYDMIPYYGNMICIDFFFFLIVAVAVEVLLFRSCQSLFVFDDVVV
jgi:hypothetical protein